MVMSHKMAYRLSGILAIVGLLLVVSLYLFADSPTVNILTTIILVLGFVFVAAGIFVSVIFYRCPHCHSRIRARGRIPEFCSECGKPM